MSINLKIPDIRELKPRITVFGVGGAGGNAVNNMIAAGLQGVDFVVANTDAQALTTSRAERIIQMGVQATEGLGAGSQPDVLDAHITTGAQSAQPHQPLCQLADPDLLPHVQHEQPPGRPEGRR